MSLSLRMRILRKIDRLAALSGSTRSEAVEKLALHSVDELIKEYSAKSPDAKSQTGVKTPVLSYLPLYWRDVVLIYSPPAMPAAPY